MTNTEKIAAFFIVLLMAVCIGLAIKVVNVEGDLGEAERVLNEQHQENIKEANIQITTLGKKVVLLKSENEKLSRKKAKIHQQTIHVIDSVERLSFVEQSHFFTVEITKLDSIRGRYLSNGNP